MLVVVVDAGGNG